MLGLGFTAVARFSLTSVIGKPPGEQRQDLGGDESFRREAVSCGLIHNSNADIGLLDGGGSRIGLDACAFQALYLRHSSLMNDELDGAEAHGRKLLADDFHPGFW